MTSTHRAYVSAVPQGYGRYSHTYQCTCGARGGNYGSSAGAQTAAGKHETNPTSTERR